MSLKKIVILDIDKQFGTLKKEMLERQGFEVTCLNHDDRSLLNIARISQNYDLAIAGIKLLQEPIIYRVIDNLLKSHDLPVLFLISDNDNELIQQTSSLSHQGYIDRNARDELLLATVQTTIIRLSSDRAYKTHLDYLSKPESNISHGHFHFLRSMDKVNRIIQHTGDLEQLLKDVLDSVLSIFDCDRANLSYPCNPDSASWHVRMESAKPEYPGVGSLNQILPMNRHTAENMALSRASDRPVIGIPISGTQLGAESDKLGHRALMSMALRPKIGDFWSFAIQQCDYDRQWTKAEENLFYEIGLRIESSLNSILYQNDLEESGKKLKETQHLARIGFWETNLITRTIFLSEEFCDIYGISNVGDNDEEEWKKKWETIVDPGDQEKIQTVMAEAIANKTSYQADLTITRPDGETRDLVVFAEVKTDATGQPVKMQGTTQDVTRQKEAERALKGLNRKLQALSDCNQALVRAEDETTLLNEICAIICEKAGYQMAWVGFITENKHQYIKPVACAGAEDIALVQNSASPYQPDYTNDHIHRSIQNGDVVIIQSIEDYPHHLRWKTDALQKGYRSCVFIPLSDQNSALLGMLCVFSDEENAFIADEIKLLEELADDLSYGITSLRVRIGLKKALADLSESNQILNAIIQSTPVAIVGIDLEGRVDFIWNPAAEQIFGWKSEEVMGKTFPMAPIHDEEEFKGYKQACAKATRLNGVIFHRKKRDGTYIDMSSYSSPIYNSDGRLMGSISVFMDVTQLRHMEIALGESEARYRSIFQNSPLGIFRATLDGSVTDINPALLTMLDCEDPYSLDVEKANFRYNLIKTNGTAPDMLSDVLTQKDTCRYQHQITRKDGSEFSADIYLKTIRDASQNPVYIEGIVEDTTERKRHEELIIQTEKMISLGSLSAGIAHEINNPLSAILTGAYNINRRLNPGSPKNIEAATKIGIDLDLLNQYLEERSVYSNIEAIRESGKKAGEIITNMLQFSRKSESQKAYHYITKIIDKTIVLAGADYDLKKQYDFRKIDIIKDFSPEIDNVAVYCVETEIEQVLLNIFKNAAQALSKKENPELSRLSIRCYCESGMVVLELEDNGPGMSDAVKTRIFEPFYTTKSVGQGTGLGLSVSYTIITENHQGTIEVESTPGVGSKFTIHLPIERA